MQDSMVILHLIFLRNCHTASTIAASLYSPTKNLQFTYPYQHLLLCWFSFFLNSTHPHGVAMISLCSFDSQFPSNYGC